MQTGSTLLTHCGARRVEREALTLLPNPVPLGTRHRPIRHDELVAAVREQAQGHGLTVIREDYAVMRGGALLFGVMDLGDVQTPALDGTGLALGLRSANDQSFALSVTAGRRVFVCDNLALSGDVLALHRKHTSGLKLGTAIAEAFGRFLEHSARLTMGLERLRQTPIADGRAREVIYEALVKKLIPLKLFPQVHTNYFDVAPAERPECQDRSLWGLHNAFTRAMKALPVASAWRATVGLGRLFGLRSKE